MAEPATGLAPAAAFDRAESTGSEVALLSSRPVVVVAEAERVHWFRTALGSADGAGPVTPLSPVRTIRDPVVHIEVKLEEFVDLSIPRWSGHLR